MAMPLLDHFHAPLYPGRRWESFHSMWSAEIAARLNRVVLSPRYFAECTITLGGPVEVDVATLDLESAAATPRNGPGVAVSAEVWAPPAVALVMPAVFPDGIEVQVFDSDAGRTLVAAIEMVSPGNKDRPETRRAFAAKCASYLQQGIGLVVVDVVTNRLANLHDELIHLLEHPDAFRFPDQTPIYTVAYRPARRKDGDQIDLWRHPLAVGEPLPTMALALRGGPTLPLELDATYAEVLARSRL